jgi:histidinol-phosphate aminotransferase
MKFDIKKMIRKECAGFQPYVAGKPVETVKRELGLKKVYKLASNENPLGPSRLAKAAVRKAAEKIFSYPDSNCWELRKAISKKFNVKPENVIAGCGSDEIIEIIGRLFFNPGDEVVVSKHAFIRYKMSGDLMGAKVVEVPMDGFQHDLPAMLAAVTQKTKAVFIANPNNPTGTYNTNDEVKAFLKGIDSKFRGNPPLVVFDEAYYEFAREEKDYPESLSYLKSYPNLIILRTFSKIYGLAGLRVGYGFANEAVADYFDRVRPPFNVNLVAQAAAVASLADVSQVTRSVKLVKQGKKYLYAELGKLDIPYVETAGNFVLVGVEPFRGSDVFKRLLKKGLIVRAMDEYDFPFHVRVSVGLPAENKLLIKALKEIMTNGEDKTR